MSTLRVFAVMAAACALFSVLIWVCLTGAYNMGYSAALQEVSDNCERGHGFQRDPSDDHIYFCHRLQRDLHHD